MCHPCGKTKQKHTQKKLSQYIFYAHTHHTYALFVLNDFLTVIDLLSVDAIPNAYLSTNL